MLASVLAQAYLLPDCSARLNCDRSKLCEAPEDKTELLENSFESFDTAPNLI